MVDDLCLDERKGLVAFPDQELHRKLSDFS
jgi:hypothetical protein